MRLQFHTGLPRIWPLAFSALALWGFVHILPTLYGDLEFSRDGVRTAGWYTDLEEQNDNIHYAYRVEDVVYGGQESWDEENSNIYSHHNGDKVEIMYLSGRPWISTRRLNPSAYLQDSETWALFDLSIVFGGIWLCAVGPRKVLVSATRT